jgi:hypothetical protein
VDRTFYRWKGRPELVPKRGVAEIIPSSEEGAEQVYHVVDTDFPPPGASAFSPYDGAR